MEIVKTNDLLYQSRRSLTSFPGLKVGSGSASGVVCSLNTTRNQVSKLSLVGVAVDMIMQGRLSVSSIGVDGAYVEFVSTSGDIFPSWILQSVVTLQDGSKPKEYYHKVAMISLIAAILYCPSVRSTFANTPERKEIFDEIYSYLDLNQPFDQIKITTEDLFRLCDIMYYGIFKDFDELACDFIDHNTFDTNMRRVIQNEDLEPVPQTIAPVLYKATAKKKAVGKHQKTLFTEPLADFFERCKKGEFLIDYPWPETRKGLIVPLSFLESFFPTESFRLMLLSVWYQIKEVRKRMDEVAKKYPGKKLAELIQEGAYDEVMGKNPINIKVMGKPGTGKTTVIEAVLASLGYPKGLINCKDSMEEDEIEGQNKFVNGTVLNIPTKAGQLHSDGGAILLEEFNLPNPGILQGALGQALAYPFILKEDGYKEKRRHPLTIYFATMNIGTAGTKPMNEALSSRFPEGYVIEDVPEDEFISILVNAGYSKSNCKKVYRIYRQILNYLRQYHEDLSLSITLRHCLNALDKLKIGFTEKQAYENTFLSQLYSSDPEVANDVRETLKVLM